MSEATRAIPGGNVVAMWLCRGGCGSLVDVTEAACDAMVVFNAHLRKRGEKPLDTTTIVACEHCRVVEERRYQERVAHARAEVERVCGELRQCPSDTEYERALVNDLRSLGCESEIAAAILDGKRMQPTTGRKRTFP